jgi:hypothetical protein
MGKISKESLTAIQQELTRILGQSNAAEANNGRLRVHSTEPKTLADNVLSG